MMPDKMDVALIAQDDDWRGLVSVIGIAGLTPQGEVAIMRSPGRHFAHLQPDRGLLLCLLRPDAAAAEMG
jgi:hypothetical protein